jgi:folate-dependent tRNA-U54 methylase TrmFO/GidA
MARIDIILPDDLEHKLRMEAGKRLGAKRGAFTEAITEAVALWISKEVPDEEMKKIVADVTSTPTKIKKK